MNKFKHVWYFLFHSKKISLLGPKLAGKTQILVSLGAKDIFGEPLKVGYESNGERFESFYIEYHGKKVLIRRGNDEKGARFFSIYQQALSQSDIVFYVFDINKYLSKYKLEIEYFDIESNEYKKGTEDYDLFVHTQLQEIKNNTPHKLLDKVVIIMTHADECSEKDRNKLIDAFSCQAGIRFDCLKNMIIPIKATDEQECINIFKKYM